MDDGRDENFSQKLYNVKASLSYMTLSVVKNLVRDMSNKDNHSYRSDLAAQKSTTKKCW